MSMTKYTFMLEHAKDTLGEAKEYYKDYLYNRETYPAVSKLYLALGQRHLLIYKDIMSTMKNELTMDKSSGVKESADEIAYIDYEKKKLGETYDMCAYKYSQI